MSRFNLLLIGGLAAGLIGWTGGTAFAAKGDAEAAADAVADADWGKSALDTASFGGIPADILEQARADVLGRDEAGVTQELSAADAREQGNLTPAEKKSKDDAVLRELRENGIIGMEQAPGLGGEGRQPGGREFGGSRESNSFENDREAIGSRESYREGNREQGGAERPQMERPQMEQREQYQPERPQMERPQPAERLAPTSEPREGSGQGGQGGEGPRY